MSINDASVLGLKNCSDNVWQAELPSGSVRNFTNGQVIKLGRGIKINFGELSAEIN